MTPTPPPRDDGRAVQRPGTPLAKLLVLADTLPSDTPAERARIRIALEAFDALAAPPPRDADSVMVPTEALRQAVTSVSVPREPTVEMIRAARLAMKAEFYTEIPMMAPIAVYRAMLTALPENVEDIGAMREQAQAWKAVCAALDTARPDWRFATERGIDSAVQTIRALATPPAPAEPFTHGITCPQFNRPCSCATPPAPDAPKGFRIDPVGNPFLPSTAPDALRLAREAVEAMDAARDALAAVDGSAWGAGRAASFALRRAERNEAEACIAYVRALPSGAAVQGEAGDRCEMCGGPVRGFTTTEGKHYCGAMPDAATPLAKSDGGESQSFYQLGFEHGRRYGTCAEDPIMIDRQEEAAWQAYSLRLDNGAKSMASAPREVIRELLKAARSVQ